MERANVSASEIGFAMIVFLYISLGFMAATGCILLSQRFLKPRFEQLFYAGFLLAIAAFYLAFTAYFEAHAAWPLETKALLVFAGFALLGIRFPLILAAGYLLHGAWDGVHEWHAHQGFEPFQPDRATAIPLAYGWFCATFDVCMAGYFVYRRTIWNTAWKGATT